MKKANVLLPLIFLLTSPAVFAMDVDQDYYCPKEVRCFSGSNIPSCVPTSTTPDIWGVPSAYIPGKTGDISLHVGHYWFTHAMVTFSPSPTDPHRVPALNCYYSNKAVFVEETRKLVLPSKPEANLGQK